MTALSRKRRKISAVAAMVLTLGALTSCTKLPADTGTAATSGGSDGDIVIGAAVGLSGSYVSFDGPPVDAFKLYVDQVNKKGGIDGHQIKFVTADMKSDPSQGPVAAQQVISQGADVVLVSCDFDWGSPAATTAIAAGKLTMSLCAGSTLFGPAGLGDLAFSAGVQVEGEAAAMAEWAYQTQGYRNVAIMFDNTLSYNTAYLAAFKTSWERLGGTIATEQTFQNTDSSVADQVSKIKDTADVDAVLAITYLPGGPNAIKQLRSGGVSQPILGVSGLSSTDWLPSVPGLKDFYVTQVASLGGDDPRPEVNEVVSQYTAAYGAPDSPLALTGYALGQMVTAAVEGTGGDTDGQALASWLQDPSHKIPTLFGDATFTSELHINQSQPQVIAQFGDDRSTVLTTVTPTSVPAAAQ